MPAFVAERRGDAVAQKETFDHAPSHRRRRTMNTSHASVRWVRWGGRHQTKFKSIYTRVFFGEAIRKQKRALACIISKTTVRGRLSYVSTATAICPASDLIHEREDSPS